MPYIPAGVD